MKLFIVFGFVLYAPLAFSQSTIFQDNLYKISMANCDGDHESAILNNDQLNNDQKEEPKTTDP